MVGLATLKIDSIFYLAGLFIGAFIFGEIEPLIDAFYNSGNMGRFTLDQLLGLPMGVVGFIVILIALGGFWGSELLEKRFGEKA